MQKNQQILSRCFAMSAIECHIQAETTTDLGDVSSEVFINEKQHRV